MKNYKNIECTKTRQGYYIGYSADGRSWRITGKSGYWSATANITKQGSISILIGFARLEELSNELANIK